jgi:hypothetical protein
MIVDFALNCFLIKIFISLDPIYKVWWAPILLQDIVLHFYIFVQIAYDWSNWDSQILDWQKELTFLEQMKEKDYPADERGLRLNIEL